jgi:hypothetical protein
MRTSQFVNSSIRHFVNFLHAHQTALQRLHDCLGAVSTSSFARTRATYLYIAKCFG